jgi:arylsulfatase
MMRSNILNVLSIVSVLSIGSAFAESRPNIVLIMADDMGYSDISPYGGEINTPNLDRLAKGGLRFTQFYNNAKCSPTRASLLTGLYSQQTGITNGPKVMKNSVTIAEVLRGSGYRTMMVGKWHALELPVDRGFDRYYGLTDGCCNFFNPGVKRDHEAQPAEKNFPRKWADDAKTFQPFTPEDPEFYTTDAFTDHALTYLDELGSGDDPFFLYVAYTAPHYPLQAPAEDIAKYRGKYLKGWDKLREERYARMIDMGIIDKNWPLSPRDSRVPDWRDVEKKEAWALDRLKTNHELGLKWEDAKSRDNWDLKMAVYAAMVDRMDQNIGRIIDKLEAQGKLDNTLIMFLSDNGGCAEIVHITQDVPPGTVDSYRTVDPPWANLQNTPFRLYKRWDNEGGIATPMIAHWPATIKAGTMTHQTGHIIDYMATFIELAGAEYPLSFDGKKIVPLEGKSLLPIFEGKEREGHEFLFWEFANSRAVRNGDWKAVKNGDAAWELYNLKSDRTEMYDLADEAPPLVAELSKAWEAWAVRCKDANDINQ